MSKLNNQSKLKVFKSGKYEYIYIYYKLGKNVIRINTKNEVVKNGMTNDFLYNSRVEGYKKANDKVIQMKKLVDNYIRIKHEEFKPEVNQKELEAILRNKTQKHYLSLTDRMSIDIEYIIPNPPIQIKVLNDYYTEFYNLKQKELNNSAGTKHYKSLQNALLDYQTYLNKKLSFQDINSKESILDFRKFLTQEHSDQDIYLTKGNLANNTIHKRITRLYTFLRYIEEKDIFTFKKEVFSLKIQKYDNDIVILSNEEIKQLRELNIQNPYWKKIIDLFVCNCYMGLRYSDLMTLTKHDFFMDSDGDYHLHKENQKTEITVEIPIQPITLDILKKYNFKLPKYTNQYFNRELKNIFEHYNLFNEVVTRKRRVINENKDIKLLKRDLISSHTCRRTFITLGINYNIPLNTLMLASGHKQISTLKSYVKKVANKEAFKGLQSN